MLTLTEAAIQSGRSAIHLRYLCRMGRIQGAEKRGRDWFVPRGFCVQIVPRGRRWAKKESV